MELPGADIFSKPEMQKMKLGDDVFMGPTGKYKTDFLPTAVSQAAGLYAGRDTPEEEWEAARRKRLNENLSDRWTERTEKKKCFCAVN